MSKAVFGAIVAIIIFVISIPTAYFILIDASQPAMESAKEGDIQQFGEDFTNYMYIAVLVIIITVISAIMIAKLKGG